MLCVALLCLSAYSAEHVQNNSKLNDKVATVSSDEDMSALFEEWMAAFGKQQDSDKQHMDGIVSSSSSPVDEERLAAFKENVKKIQQCNAANKTFTCE